MNMDYIDDLYSKANHIFSSIILIFIILLIIDTLIFNFIPISVFKITGLILLILAIIGYGSNLWLQHYENYVCMSDSPKDYLWTFRDFLDDYTGKTYRDYTRACDNYEPFEDSMDKFSEIFADGGKNNFSETLLHYKNTYKYTDSNLTRKKIKHKANNFLKHKYTVLADFVKHHNHQKLWSVAEHHPISKANKKVLFDEDKAMLKLMNN